VQSEQIDGEAAEKTKCECGIPVIPKTHATLSDSALRIRVPSPWVWR